MLNSGRHMLFKDLFFIVWCFIYLCNLAGQDPGTDGDLQVLWILWLFSPAFLSSDKLEQNNIFQTLIFLAFSFAARMKLELLSVDMSIFAVVNCLISKLCRSVFFLHFSLEAGYQVTCFVYCSK